MPLIHLLLNLAIIALLGLISAALCLRFPRARVPMILCGVMLGVAGYGLSRRPDWQITLMPFADMMFYTNWLPYAVALLTPAATGCVARPFAKARVAALCGALMICAGQPWLDFWREPAAALDTAEFDSRNVCRQSGPDTCGAATVVTLLHRHGVAANEAEIARLAYCKRGRGSDFPGQYRALKRRLAERPDKTVRLSRPSARELALRREWSIVAVGLSEAPRNGFERMLCDQCSWTPGVMHSVVLMGPHNGDPERVRIGDPDFGVEVWSIRAFETLYQGYALTLEPTSDDHG